MRLDAILNECKGDFEANAAGLDQDGVFAGDNLRRLLDLGAYKALIPEELGGGGARYSAMCHFLRELAQACPSTSLTLSMHQHLLAVQVFKYHQDRSSEPLLRNVAANDLALLSTGGGDWLSSNGSAEKVEGGYRINVRKAFCSGAEMADIAVMSCAYDDGNEEHVLHFAVPMNADGVTIQDDWDAMGMRGTGSNSVQFTNVFVPDEKVVLQRPRGQWHPVWAAVCTYAHPIFLAPYVGVAEAIADKTVEVFRKRPNQERSAVAALGRMANELHVTRLAWNDMVLGAGEYDTKPSVESSTRALMGKSLVTTHGRISAQHAMEALGGYSYFRKVGIERLYRDLLAGEFHPLQASKQEEVMGRCLLGGTPAL